MDTLTHAISGALLGRLLCVRPVAPPLPASVAAVLAPHGRFSAAWDHAPGHLAPWQAATVGAVAAAFPDIDALAMLAGDFTYLRWHRGVTHSVLLAPLWGWLLALVLARWFEVTRGKPGGWKVLFAPALCGVLLHIAGDWITPFGTMMLAPLSDRRFGLGAMFVIDLAFSAILVGGLVLAAMAPRQRWPAALGLLGACAWVGLAWTGQREGEAVARGHAQREGLAVQWIEAMPRPASPFNWTLAIFDGSDYRVAHVNTRRSEPLVASPSDFFVRRLSAPYLPASQAQWTRVPRFGGGNGEEAPVWVLDAWSHEAFAPYRWFAGAPALLTTATRIAEDGSEERCAAFRDLRFEFPGREASPFRYGVCLGAGGAARLMRFGAKGWQPL